jgi:hypothetical protein
MNTRFIVLKAEINELKERRKEVKTVAMLYESLESDIENKRFEISRLQAHKVKEKWM